MLESGDRESRIGVLGRLVAASATAGGLVALLLVPGVGAAGLGVRKAADDFKNMNVERITRFPSEKSVVYAADGRPIVTFFDEFRDPVRLDQVAPVMRQAMVAIEDSRFYEHGALDAKAVLRAITRNAEAGQTREGGSTLTQQYAKNLLLSNARTKRDRQRVTATTFIRKVRELRYALQLEQTMSKDSILEGYLNIAYFGAGAYGVQAAAQRYFSKPASALTLPEAALLAGITKNPFAYDPLLHPKAAKERRDVVLARMGELGVISAADERRETSRAIRLTPTRPKGGCATSEVPFYCMYVRAEMIRILAKGKPERFKEAEERLQRGGYTIRTSFDTRTQEAVQRAVDSRASTTSDRVAAEAMVEVGTGRLKALVTSKRFGTDKPKTTLSLAADAAHGGGVGVSAGSTFKIFTLLAALDAGMPVRTSFRSPGSMTIGGFTNCKGRELPAWHVGNSHDSQSGKFNMRTGTWGSVNTYFAQLQKAVGICKSVKMAQRFGMVRGDGTPLQEVPPQVLGSNEIDMVHLAAAYAGIANHGVYCPPVSVIEATGPGGRPVKLDTPDRSCRRAVSPWVADTTYTIMRGVLGPRGTANGIEKPSKYAAGKTGTCENFSCAVFAGISRNLASAVAYWDYRGGFRYPVTGVYGAGIPAEIWSASLIAAHKADRPLVSLPDTRGMSLGSALATLDRAGFRTTVSLGPVTSQLPKGTVAFTSPSAQIARGGTVTVFLSNGRAR
ncbi:transglycosylase domain-containing protein [Actinocorallia sp. A-T 12471]|uniref:transglycosylase domain-containing protein n=1 Tax=Actinocorallia sp. A-T 12471 TaxID=3089813 RepID=UPI0029D03B50|nr:transglycosylase domain-containing protein [Actinocorallia sp. A-T 12471]MDX6742607.1 transglycosylase domain-containing protein [Actinocorallia sp. A-T 12471]